MPTDEFKLVPTSLPDHPRLLCTSDDIQRVRESAGQGTWFLVAVERLLDASDLANPVRETLPTPESNGVTAVLLSAKRHALAYHLTDDVRHLGRAMVLYRMIASAYLNWPLLDGHNRATTNSLAESRFTIHLSQVYDLLAATDLHSDDDALFRESLEKTRETSDRSPHTACGNHNTWALTARLATGLSLGDLSMMYDALYGCCFNDVERYGLVHQLRHDFLSDGFHWERAPGYHFYTLMGFTESALMLQHAGVDLWNVELPSQDVAREKDLHRGYGPDGMKTLKAAYDVPFYYSFENGDFSLIHDSGLENLRGAWIWGPVYEIAWQAYGDEKYTWLLNRIEHDYRGSTERKYPALPMSLEASHGEFDFVRIRDTEWPAGRVDLKVNTQISLTGRHENGCTLLPDTGVTVLRKLESGIGAQLTWGPHSAGHQSPAALHLDIWANGKMLTCAPISGGYGDANHLTWNRTTIAHNTVTVDETAMFPCDEESDSIWEADSWRERPSDGELLLFQPGLAFSACRVVNESVYPGVRLDRTVILTSEFILDVFRVTSDEEHLYDLAMHLYGEVERPSNATDVNLGERRGYQHLRNGAYIGKSNATQPIQVNWKTETGTVSSKHVFPQGADLIAARPPRLAEDMKPQRLGAIENDPERELMIARTRAADALYVSLWVFDRSSVTLELESGDAKQDVALVTQRQDSLRWIVPFANTEVVADTCS